MQTSQISLASSSVQANRDMMVEAFPDPLSFEPYRIGGGNLTHLPTCNRTSGSIQYEYNTFVGNSSCHVPVCPRWGEMNSYPLGREGYVYLLRAEGTSRYKIGRSKNPVIRHQVLQRQSPYALRVVDCFQTPDSALDEKELHKRFKHLRVNGEWFEAKTEEELFDIKDNFMSWTSAKDLGDAIKQATNLCGNSKDKRVVTAVVLFRGAAREADRMDFFYDYMASLHISVDFIGKENIEISNFITGLIFGAIASLGFLTDPQEDGEG